jgi:hypothetical protein
MNFEKNHIQLSSLIGAIITHTIDNTSFVINGAWVNLPKVGFLGCAYFVKINSCTLNKSTLESPQGARRNFVFFHYPNTLGF